MPSGSIPMITGVVYAYLAFAVLALLWYSRRFTRRRALVFLAASALLGFLVFAPVFPFMVQEVVLGNLPVLIGLVVFIVLVFLAGRIICGQVCAVGAVQELVYLIPVKKHRHTANRRQVAIRAGVFLVILVAGAGFSVNLLARLGLRPSSTSGSQAFPSSSSLPSCSSRYSSTGRSAATSAPTAPCSPRSRHGRSTGCGGRMPASIAGSANGRAPQGRPTRTPDSASATSAAGAPRPARWRGRLSTPGKAAKSRITG